MTGSSKTAFGNSYRSFSRIQGRDGTIVNYGGEGASLFVVSKEGGWKEYDPGESGPIYSQIPLVAPAMDAAEIIRVPGTPQPTSLVASGANSQFSIGAKALFRGAYHKGSW